MASRRTPPSNTAIKSHRKRRRKLMHRDEIRRDLRFESLEDRRVMAAGPGLVAIHPSTTAFAVGSDGDLFLDQNDVLNEAPRELILQFSPGQVIDLATLSQG